MKLEITTGNFDDFSLSKELIAFDDKNNVYDVFVSSKSHIAGCCIGKIKVIIKKKKVICWVLPLMTPPSPYSIIEKSILKRFSDIFTKVK